MKVFWGIIKFIAVLAAIAGVVFVVMHYFDKIMAFLRKYLNLDGILKKECCDEEDCFEDVCDEVFAEEAGVAEENDFEG